MLILIIFFSTVSCHGFLDYIADKSEDLAKTAAYTDAVSDLLNEVSKDSSLSSSANQLDQGMRQLRTEASRAGQVSREIDAVLEGPNWKSKHLLQNIRKTTDFVRRVKRLLIRLGILGVDGATALNTFETNVSLNDIMKNQQTQILMEREKLYLELLRKQQERKAWNDFIETEKNVREAK